MTRTLALALVLSAVLLGGIAAFILWMRAQDPRPPSGALDVTLTWTTGHAPPEWRWSLRCAPDGSFVYRWRAEGAAPDAPWRERRGTWTVVNGSGKYLGMTGTGTFVTTAVADRKKTTHWEGEVVIPE